MNSLDLFCGSGGLSLGLHNAGICNEKALDLCQDSVDSFNFNISKTAVVHDVRDCVLSGEIKKFKGIDLVVGGPPCQGFCSINPKRNINDPRNSLLDTYLAAIKLIKPKTCLIENVPGLISLGKGWAIKKLEQFFKEEKYNYSYMVLQAAHYGVPQSRWRLILIASKCKNISFPHPTHKCEITPNFQRGNELTFKTPKDDLFTQHLEEVNTVKSGIHDLPKLNNGGEYRGKYTKKPKSNFQILCRGKSNNVLNHKTRKLSAIQLKRICSIKPGQYWIHMPKHLIPNNLKKLFKKYGKGMGCTTLFRRLQWNEIFSTILTSPDPYWGAFVHPSQDRVLSARECARAQSFPDSFYFSGSLTSQYRQIGNSVPVLLGQRIGELILNFK